jgi:hypothetical protein
VNDSVDLRGARDAMRRKHRWILGAAGTIVLAVAFASVAQTPGDSSAPAGQTAWSPPGTPPLSDAQAAARVVRRPENRPGNAQYNDYVPTGAQLRAFYSARSENGELIDKQVPEFRYVTGRPGLKHPSTDELIQWTSYKWGIPADWIRAEMAVESWWHQSDRGDRSKVSDAWYGAYPPQVRIAGSLDVYESMGISQVKWLPDGSDDPGSEPLRWESTAFALDLYGAKVRFFYSGDCHWCGPGYSAGQKWNSIGGWFEPYPWNNPGQRQYIQEVQRDLAERAWEQPGF